MTKDEFRIGQEFYTSSGKWRCTDIGTRVIVAIKLDQEDPRNYNGPPYSIAEHVFDEYDMEGCILDPIGIATCNHPCYSSNMIIGFKHKGLEHFFTQGSKAGIQPKHAERLRLILGRLQVSTCPQDMNLPGLGLHELSGDRQGDWAVKVSGNWRVTFRFIGKDADAVDYEDYH